MLVLLKKLIDTELTSQVLAQSGLLESSCKREKERNGSNLHFLQLFTFHFLQLFFQPFFRGLQRMHHLRRHGRKSDKILQSSGVLLIQQSFEGMMEQKSNIAKLP